MPDTPAFDPYAILAALERHRVAYVLIGAFARIIQGAEELTDGVDITPALRERNRQRLTRSGTSVPIPPNWHSRPMRPPPR